MKISKLKKMKRHLFHMAGIACSHCGEKFKYGEIGHFVPALGIWICKPKDQTKETK